MTDRITIEGHDGAFAAYIARPKAVPAPAVVVLQELFGVNADIRKTCDELAEQGFIAVAPDLFWRQEPGVDLSVTSEPDWQHGLRLYQAYDRDAGAKDVKETADVVAKLPECSGKVAVLGYCLGGLMTFLTAARYGVDAAVAYHGGDTEKYLGEIDGLNAPLLMHLAEEDEFISKAAQAEIKAALAKKPNTMVYSYPGQNHAFSRHGGVHYNAEAAALAHERTYEFLNRQLRRPSVASAHKGEKTMTAKTTQTKPSIVFCHGLWADGSCFGKLIVPLQAEGYECIAAQYGLNSTAEDVALVKATIGRVSGPVILVGHSYGGTVITGAGVDDRVAALVYICALAPDADETSQTQQSNFPKTDVFSHIDVVDGRIWLRREGTKYFCGDLSEQDQKLVWATQGVPKPDLFDAKAGGTAWKSKPSWYIVGKNDHTVHPDLERFFAKRISAKVTELDSSHVPMLSQPERVIDVIRAAAKGVQTATVAA